MNSFGLNCAAVNASSHKASGARVPSALLTALAYCAARAGRIRQAAAGHVIGATNLASGAMSSNAIASIKCESGVSAVGTDYVAGMSISSTAGLFHLHPVVRRAAWTWIWMQGRSSSGWGAMRGSTSLVTLKNAFTPLPGSLRGAAVTWSGLNAMSVVPGAVRRARAAWRAISAMHVQPGAVRARAAWTWIWMQGRSNSSSGAMRASTSLATLKNAFTPLPGTLRGAAVTWRGLNAMSVVPGVVRRARAAWRAISAMHVQPGAGRGAAARWKGSNALSVVPLALRNTSAQWLTIIRMSVVPVAMRSAVAKWRSSSTLSGRPGSVRGGAALAGFAFKTLTIPLKFVAARAGMLAQALLRSSLSANYIGRTSMHVMARCSSIPLAIRPGQATQAMLARLRSVVLRYRFVSALVTGQARLSADAVANADVPALADRTMIVTNDFRVFFISPEPRTMRIT